MTSSLIENLPESFSKKNPNQFIDSLYALIEGQEYKHLISWSENNNNSFTIYKPHVFAQVLLPSLCKHSNLDSFIRQLNMYCFKKYRTKAQSDSISYWHPYFVRGQKELLNNIIRKNPRRILKQKEAQLKGLALETRSSNSTASREQEYDDSRRTGSTTPTTSTTSTMKQDAFFQEKSESNNKPTNVYGCLMQLMNKMNTKCDQNTMSMIRNYLNDDDEEEYEPSVYGSKKIKYSTDYYPVQEQTHSPYVQMDFNTLNFQPLQSTESREVLKTQLPRTTQIFNGRDFFRCQNLIQNLYEVQNKNADSYYNGSESTQSYLHEMSSGKMGDFSEEYLH